MQNELDKREQFLGITMKKAVVPHSPKPFWQHMLHDEVQELFPREFAKFCRLGLAIDVLECDLPILVGNNIFLTDHSSVEVARQIFQGSYATANINTVCYPFPGDFWWD